MSPATLRLRSDEHLVSLFRAGREDAFEAIHERHRRRLHAVASRALRSSGGDAEGVVQEAFLRAHRALRDDRRPIELKPWLHRVVRNLCIDELRRNRLPTTELDDGDRAGAGEDIYCDAQSPARAAAADRGPRRPARAAARRAADARARRAQPRRGRERARGLPGRLAPARQAGAQRPRRRRRGARRRLRRDPRRPADRPRRAPAAVRARAPAPPRLLRLPRVPRRPEGDARPAARARSRRSGSARSRASCTCSAAATRRSAASAPRSRRPAAAVAARRRAARRTSSRRVRQASTAPSTSARPRHRRRGRRQVADRQADPARHQAARRTSRSRTVTGRSLTPASRTSSSAARPRQPARRACVGEGLAVPRTQDGKIALSAPAHVPDLPLRDFKLLAARRRPPHGADRLRREASSTRPVVISVGTLCKRR